MPGNKVIIEKIRRLESGLPPRFIDLFSGCGGITLGFVTAGFIPVGSVEIDPLAAASHGANFGPLCPGTNRQAHSAAIDINSIGPSELFRTLGLRGRVESQVDVLVGGPPCQAYARVGRAKLRHEAHRNKEDDAEIAFLVDGRINLWQRYLHYVRKTKPIALLMENVPDILNHGGKNVAETVAQHLREEGYRVGYTLLNAAWYGVPQTRERMFLVGFHEETGLEPLFPAPTHFAELPSGYEGTRATARKHILPTNGLFGVPEHCHRWVDDPKKDSGLPEATTAGEALADLPAIFALDLLESSSLRRGRKDPSEPCKYSTSRPSTAYSALMRKWPGFESPKGTTGHVVRYLPRDFKIFQLMEEGWQYPEVWRFVEEKRLRLLEARHAEGRPVNPGSLEGREFIRQWTLPYDPSKFPNKWWKLYRNKPVRTLMAHLGKDSYSHIHFDDEQARTISIREAARLQSFPDGFAFRGTMNPAFKQIGNAVPPLLAYAIAMTMRDLMGCEKVPDIRCSLLGLNPKLITTTSGRS